MPEVFFQMPERAEGDLAKIPVNKNRITCIFFLASKSLQDYQSDPKVHNYFILHKNSLQQLTINTLNKNFLNSVNVNSLNCLRSPKGYTEIS